MYGSGASTWPPADVSPLGGRSLPDAAPHPFCGSQVVLECLAAVLLSIAGGLVEGGGLHPAKGGESSSRMSFEDAVAAKTELMPITTLERAIGAAMDMKAGLKKAPPKSRAGPASDDLLQPLD